MPSQSQRRGGGRARRCRRLPARPHPRSAAAGIGPGSSRGRQSAFKPWRREPDMSAHIGPTLPGLPDARGITPVGRQPSPGPWRQAPGVSAHIWGPLPSGPPFPPGWRQPPDVSAHVGSLPPPVDARGATSAPPTCVNARVGLTAGWGSPGETARIGPPPPRAESRRGPSPSKGSGRGCRGAGRARPRTPAGGAQRSCPCQKLHPMRTRGTNFLAAPKSRRPANWGSAASRRARVGNRESCVHAGRGS